MPIGTRIAGWWLRTRPLEKAYDVLLARGAAPSSAKPAGEAKGILRSRSVVAALVGFGAWFILLSGWVTAELLQTILEGLEVAGIAGAGVFRVLARVPTRGSGQ